MWLVPTEAVHRDLVAWLTPVIQANRKRGQLAELLVEKLRRRRILLPCSGC